MIRRTTIGRVTVGLALGRREGTNHPANANAPRIVRGPGGRTVWFPLGRVWVVITAPSTSESEDA